MERNHHLCQKSGKFEEIDDKKMVLNMLVKVQDSLNFTITDCPTTTTVIRQLRSIMCVDKENEEKYSFSLLIFKNKMNEIIITSSCFYDLEDIGEGKKSCEFTYVANLPLELKKNVKSEMKKFIGKFCHNLLIFSNIILII